MSAILSIPPLTRSSHNPLLIPSQVHPSREDLKVDGVFNAGATRRGDEVILLCRVAESAISSGGYRYLPTLDPARGYQAVKVECWDTADPNLDFSDSRFIRNRKTRLIHRLTSLSHFRLARGTVGGDFTIDQEPWIIPAGEQESWGIEDPRITKLGDRYWITYSAISADGVGVGLISTTDFVAYERHGMILPPANKDAIIFPEPIKGDLWMLHRPINADIGGLNIWACRSKDLLHWTDHRLVYRAGQRGAWENGRVGAGAPPVKTMRGWLLVYHGADEKHRYHAGLMLLDLKDPTTVLGLGSLPFFSPEEDYETEGFFGKVVFPMGVVEGPEGLWIYYGAADDKVCEIFAPWDRIWASLDS